MISGASHGYDCGAHHYPLEQAVVGVHSFLLKENACQKVALEWAENDEFGLASHPCFDSGCCDRHGD